jgi:hypothetical protein
MRQPPAAFERPIEADVHLQPAYAAGETEHMSPGRLDSRQRLVTEHTVGLDPHGADTFGRQQPAVGGKVDKVRAQ